MGGSTGPELKSATNNNRRRSTPGRKIRKYLEKFGGTRQAFDPRYADPELLSIHVPPRMATRKRWKSLTGLVRFVS